MTENEHEFEQQSLNRCPEDESTNLSEIRDCITPPKLLIVKESNWSKVKHALIDTQKKIMLESEMIEHLPILVPDEDRPDLMDILIVKQDVPPQRMVPRKLSKMDTKSEIKTGNLEGEGETQATGTSLIEDPILVKIIKLNRNVGKFSCKPESIPNAVCFEIPGADLSHRDVKLQMNALLQTCPEVQIVTIQFQHRALVNNQKEMNNRWILTTNSVASRNLLSGKDLDFNGQVVQLRSYDDVINVEYHQFVRMTNFAKMMDSRQILM